MLILFVYFKKNILVVVIFQQEIIKITNCWNVSKKEAGLFCKRRIKFSFIRKKKYFIFKEKRVTCREKM